MGSLTSHTQSLSVEGPLERQLKDEQAKDLDKPLSVLDCSDPPSVWKEIINSSKQTASSFAQTNELLPSFLNSLFPILIWGRSYTVKKFRKDFVAGLTLASLAIPQGIGYASLAKMDPQYGLYTGVVPPLIYAVMGSSREIAIGPVAVVSLLLSAMVQPIVDPLADPIGYRNLVLTATFFAGMFQVLFGVCRLGFLIDFLSHAAIVGFMGGAAIVIGLQQLKGLFAITHFTNKTDIVSVLGAVVNSFHEEWHPLNFFLGCSFLIFILSARMIAQRNKRLFWLQAIAPLTAVILATVIVYLTGADKHGVKIVKHVKSGINPSSAHLLEFTGPYIGSTVKIGLITAVVALTEAMAVGRSFASMGGYLIEGNKEMLAMGTMNIAGSLTSCYVATGSFSRTAVNYSAGCQTAISNVVMAITMIIALEALTKLLYYTPIAILASVIISALPGLIDLPEAYKIWKLDKFDFLALIGTFFGVLFASVEIGLLTAIIISFARVVFTAIRPSTEVLGRLNGTEIFCDVNQYPLATVRPSGLLIIRVNSALLCFANANFIKERIARYVMEEMGIMKETMNTQGRTNTNRIIILDLSNVMQVDTSGIIALEELHKKLETLGVDLAIASPQWHVTHKLKLANIVDKFGRGRFYLTVSEAVDACFANSHSNAATVV